MMRSAAIWRSLLALVVITALSACSLLEGKSESQEQPAELSKLPASSLDARVVWRAGAGEASKKDFYGLRLALDASYLYAADTAGKVTAFSLKDGRSAWQAQSQPRLASGVGIAGEKLLVGTLDGEVIALNADKGAIAWRASISSEVLVPPVGNEQTIIVRTGDGRVYGLAAADGQRLWAFDRVVPTLSLRGVSQPVIADDRVFAGLDNGKLVALDLATGRLLWEEAVAVPSGRSEIERLVDVDADPVVSDNVVYAVSVGGAAVALDTATGNLKWRQELSSHRGLVVDSDRVYASGRDGRVWALDRQNGAVLWSQDALKHRQLTQPVVHNGQVAVGDLEGYIHWLSPEDGSLRGRLSAGRSAFIAPPVVVGDRLYVLGRAGDITAIELRGSP